MVDGSFDKQQWNSFSSGSSNSNNAKVSFKVQSDWTADNQSEWLKYFKGYGWASRVDAFK